MKIIAITLFLFLSQVVCGQSQTDFRDFSQNGSEYKILNGLRFKSDDISFSGNEQIEILGRSFRAAKFSLTTTISVQTLSTLGLKEVSVYKKIPASFEIFVAEDTNRILHDKIIQEIFGLWAKRKLYSGEYFFDFSSNESDYLLTWTPDLVNVKGFYFVWFNGRVAKIVFKGYQNVEDEGWGVMDSFTATNFRIRLAGKDFEAYRFPLRPQKKFLKLFQEGFFKAS